MFGQDTARADHSGIYLGLSVGTWFPDNKNKVLGNPLILGFSADYKFSKNTLGINFDLIGFFINQTTEPVKIKFNDTVLVRNEYFGGQVSIDYGRELWGNDRLMLDALCGLGYGEMNYYHADRGVNVSKRSLIINPGLGIRYLVSKKIYLQFKTQYYIANYKLKDNVSTDFSGNYLVTKLIIGGR